MDTVVDISTHANIRSGLALPRLRLGASIPAATASVHLVVIVPRAVGPERRLAAAVVATLPARTTAARGTMTVATGTALEAQTTAIVR